MRCRGGPTGTGSAASGHGGSCRPGSRPSRSPSAGARRGCRPSRTRRRASSGTRRSWTCRCRRSACFFAGSSTITQCQPWRFEPVGACRAISRHSSTVARSTGRSKSRRLRTERVVVRTSSADRFSFMAPSVAGDDESMSDRVTISIDASGVADVRLNRPDKRNALDGAMFAGVARRRRTVEDRARRARRRAVGGGRVVLRRARLLVVPVDGGRRPARRRPTTATRRG